jgi:DNA-binding IclR family transcriptional regulator
MLEFASMSTQSSRPTPHTGVQVIARAGAILRSLNGAADGLSLAQISDRVGVARSTVHRIIRALEAEQLVVAASPSGGYRLGPAVAALAASLGVDHPRELRAVLERIAHETLETVDLAVLSHDQVVFVDQVTGGHRLRAVSAVGEMFPAYCTANGKALLAQLPQEYVEWLLPQKLPALTRYTITSRDHLLAELDDIRRTGLARDRGEHTDGICAVGTAVTLGTGTPAAITVVIPADRFQECEQRVGAALLRARREVARRQRGPLSQGVDAA